jgi:DNA-binding transcriptional regulator PaaX
MADVLIAEVVRHEGEVRAAVARPRAEGGIQGEQGRAVVRLKEELTFAEAARESARCRKPRPPGQGVVKLSRFVDVVAELPRTEATLRVRKAELRARGRSASTWDAEAG